MNRPVGISTAGIRASIPHRYPIMLVDRVTELVPGERLTALKAVTCNEPWYRELPESAVDFAYPQVMLIESWCQAAGLLVTEREPNPSALAGTVMLFGGMADIRFHREVFPGDVLEHRVRLLRAVSDAAIFEGESVVAGETVLAVGRVAVATRPATGLKGALA